MRPACDCPKSAHSFFVYFVVRTASAAFTICAASMLCFVFKAWLLGSWPQLLMPFTPIGSASSDLRTGPGCSVERSIQPAELPLNRSGARWMGNKTAGLEAMPLRRFACHLTDALARAESCIV